MAPAATTTRDQSVWHVTTARRARSRRPALAVVAGLCALALLTVGIALGRGSVEDPAPVPAISPHADDHHARTADAGRTETGAVATATNFLTTLTSRPYVSDPIFRAETLRAIALPDDRDRLADRARDAARPGAPGDPLGAAFAPPDISAWRFVPLGYRIDAFTGGRAVVEIWAVQVTAGAGTVDVPATATWTTTRLPLVWAESAWKLDVARASTEPGPTPGAGPAAQSADLDVIAADQRFEEYRHDVR